MSHRNVVPFDPAVKLEMKNHLALAETTTTTTTTTNTTKNIDGGQLENNNHKLKENCKSVTPPVLYFRKNTSREIHLPPDALKHLQAIPPDAPKHLQAIPPVSPRCIQYLPADPPKRVESTDASNTTTSLSSCGSLSDTDSEDTYSSESDTTEDEDGCGDDEKKRSVTARSIIRPETTCIPEEDMQLFEDLKPVFSHFNGKVSWLEVHLAMTLDENGTSEALRLTREIQNSGKSSAEFLFERKSVAVIFGETMNTWNYTTEKGHPSTMLCTISKKLGTAPSISCGEYYKHCFRIRQCAVVKATLFSATNFTTRDAVDNEVIGIVRINSCHISKIVDGMYSLITSFKVECNVLPKPKRNVIPKPEIQ